MSGLADPGSNLCCLQAATGYFDAISEVVTQGQSSTTALKGSTEASQF